MKKQTTTKKKTPAAKPVQTPATTPAVAETVATPIDDFLLGKPVIIAINLIDPSPFNYRRFFDPVEITALAETLRTIGAIHPITVREVKDGRYEEVVGEKRLRAAIEAGYSHISAVIRELTDEQAVEMQLAENWHRSDPHPMDEAFAIGKLKKLRKSVAEIALRLGKGEAVIYSRIKLLDLIPDLQEVFSADKYDLRDAVELSTLDKDAQAEFFSNYCENWKERENFSIPDIASRISNYKANLKKAPFDREDPELFPGAGPCSSCPFHSVNIGTLFPDPNGVGTCRKISCYEAKAQATVNNALRAMILAYKPTAFIEPSWVSDDMGTAIEQVAEAEGIPHYPARDIQTLKAPTKPERSKFVISTDSEVSLTEERERDEDDDDYENDGEFDEDREYEDDDDDEYNLYGRDDDDDEGRAEHNPYHGDPVVLTAEQAIDEEGYSKAMGEYQEKMTGFLKECAARGLQCGLWVSSIDNLRPVYFILCKEERNRLDNEYRGGPRREPLTAGKFKEVLKEGKATKEQIEDELARMDKVEERATANDRVVVQEAVYKAFDEFTTDEKATYTTTPDCEAAFRFLIYNSLGYSRQRDFVDIVAPQYKEDGFSRNRNIPIDFFYTMTDRQVACMVHLAMLDKSESKDPTTTLAQLLYRMASHWVDVPAIEKARKEVSDTRKDNKYPLIQKLKRKLRKVTPPEPGAAVPSGDPAEGAGGVTNTDTPPTPEAEPTQPTGQDGPIAEQLETPTPTEGGPDTAPNGSNVLGAVADLTPQIKEPLPEFSEAV